MSEAEHIVYDLDGTLVHGDVGHAFIKQLLTDSWLRMLLAGLSAPMLIPAMKTKRFRRPAVSMFLWIGTVGRAQRIPRMAEDFAGDYPLTILPGATACLRADLLGPANVIIATGALDMLSQVLIKRLQLPREPVLVASTIKPAFGGYIVGRQCNGAAKVQALAGIGITRIDRAYTDAMIDWPLLDAAREPILVSNDEALIAAMRGKVGAHLQVMAP